MLVETFDEDCNFGLYTLKYHLLDPKVINIKRFGKESVLNSILNENFHVLIKQVYKRTSQCKTDNNGWTGRRDR